MRVIVPLLLLLAALSAAAAELRLESVDTRGNPVWSRIEVRNADGRMFQPSFALRDRSARNRPGGGPWYIGSFVAQGEVKRQQLARATCQRGSTVSTHAQL